MSPERHERLFIALAPPEPVRTALSALAAGCHTPGARPVPAENFHLTLAFLGSVRPSGRDAVARWLGDFSCPRFAVTLDVVDRFAGPQVVYAGSRSVVPALVALKAAIDDAVSTQLGNSWSPEARRFIPHVTLLRSARSLPPASGNHRRASIEWPVSRCTLFASRPRRDGVRYEPVAESLETVG